MTYSPPEAPATEKQIAFIKSLLEQRQFTEEVAAHIAALVAADTMTKSEASKRIEWMLAQPKSEKPKTAYGPPPPEGMHKVEGKIFKVYKTRNGHVVAAELREIDGAWGFEYQGKRGLKGLSDSTRMPAEEAKAFGKTYGICVRCAAQLTDERSIFAGYGPVCAKNEGWHYPSMDEAMEGLGILPSIPESKSSEWYEAPTVEEAMAKLDAITEIEFGTPIPEQPDDFDEVAEEGEGREVSAFEKAWAEGGSIGMEKEHDLAGGGGPIVMPDDGDILTPEERAEYEARKRGDYPGTTVGESKPLTEGPLRMELLPEDL
jgi:Family of unknown function (DUF6011)